MSRLDDLLEGITAEDILEREGWDYKLTHGSRGEQINMHECPFCGGSEWKVYLNRETGLGNCFHGSCQETFNIYKLANQAAGGGKGSGFAYLEALADEIGWRPKRARVELEVDEDVEWDLPTCLDLPTKSGDNLRYLTKRGVSSEATKRFNLKYCQDGWFKYTKVDGEPGFMNFKDRVIIPVYDLDGTMVTFQGRDITGKSDRKYMFPPGLPGTSAFLYNGHRCLGKETVIMNEGAMDVIRTEVNLETSKFREYGVIGSFGIHLSTGRDGKDQLAQFLTMKRRGLKAVIIMWDGEKGAFEKALKAAKSLTKIGLRVKVGLTPKGKDPGELSSAETIRTVENAVAIDDKSIFRFKVKPVY